MIRRLAVGYFVVAGAYLLAAGMGIAGRKDANDHPSVRSQVGPGWY